MDLIFISILPMLNNLPSQFLLPVVIINDTVQSVPIKGVWYAIIHSLRTFVQSYMFYEMTIPLLYLGAEISLPFKSK